MKKTTRILALLLCVMMLLAMLPAGVIAADSAVIPLLVENDEEPIDPTIPIYENTQYTFAERAADLVARMSIEQKGSQMVSAAPAISASSLGGGALNVPATKNLAAYQWWCEALHGFSHGTGNNSKNATSYPQNLTVASSWDPDLYYREACAIGDEVRERAVRNDLNNTINLNFYSPTVNMHRDPRWGRNEESYSEDVYLMSQMATQFVFGLEGKYQDGTMKDPDGYYNGHATLKHYAANNTEAIRTTGGATTDFRAIREYFTAPYRNVIKAADVSAVMTAYSSLNGEPCSFSSYLMDTLLRQTFGFSGHITSDCDSASTIANFKFINPYTGKVLTAVEQMSGAIAHGEDLECNEGISGNVGNYRTLAKSLVATGAQTDKGTFTENTLDVSLLRLMEARISTGEFDDNLALRIATDERIAKQTGDIGWQTPERLALIDEINKESVVMLKNDGILPLSIPEGEFNVAIVGAWQTDMYLGLYAATQLVDYDQISIQEGITNAFTKVNPNTNFTYIVKNTLTAEDEAAIAAADVAIVVAGTGNSYSAEGRDRSSNILPNGQADLISQVGKLNDKTVAIMETCGSMQVKTFQDDVNAILWSSFGGLHKGVGFASILIGETNPSGKLTDTWYQNVNNSGESDIPGINDYNMYATNGSNGRTYMYYVGKNAPSYPFGYGLSYTSFAYSNLKIDKTAYDANDTVKVSFDVTNTGSVAGKEIAQLYIAQPEAPAELLRPIKRLQGFDKILLAPGETQMVSLEVSIPDLAYFSEADDCYAVDTGLYQVQVGGNSRDIVLTENFTVSGEMDVYPEVLSVKANQSGDTELGIEERVIFDMGQTINPQLTVAMNNEKLYGYVIAHQNDKIHSVASSPLPEGMTFSYASNRPSVVKVEGNVIKAVGPGVATVTVTGELDGHVVTADFVAYVMASAKIDGITVNGQPLEGFARDKFSYELSYEGDGIPQIAAISANPDLDIEVQQMSALPGIALVRSTSRATGETLVYRIGAGAAPVSTDFSEGWEAAQAKNWAVAGGTENATFGEDGLTIVSEPGTVPTISNRYAEPGFGDWIAQTHVHLAAALSQDGPQVGMLVYDDDNNYIRYSFQQVTTTSRNKTTISRVLRVYTCEAGTETQTATVTLSGTITDLDLKINKRGKEYSFGYSTDGNTWKDISGTASLAMAYPQLGVYACSGNGANIAPITATFDGINIYNVSDLYPRLSELKINGADVVGFDPEVFGYNLIVGEDDTEVPVITAKAADDAHKVTINQLDAATGVANVTVASGAASASYSICLNYEPESEYFADGEMSDRWTVLKEDPETYAIEKGKGAVLPTQYGDIHNADSGYVTSWNNVLLAPAMGNWEAVAKVVFPVKPKANYQMNLFMVWQDEANYLRQTLQNPLRVTPGWEKNDSYNASNLKQPTNCVAAADGSVTVYFLYNKVGNTYTFKWSQDGVNFEDMGKLEGVDFLDPKIGLFATQHSNSTPIDVQYEYVAITNLGGVEQMTYPEMLTWAAQNAADYVAADVPAVTAENIVFDAVPHGYTLTVESSDPSVIAPDGTVTPAAKDKDIILTFTVSEGETTATSTAKVKVPGTNPVELPFTDIEEGRFYYNALVWAVENGITTGTEPTLFEPDSACTRAQIVTFLWRAAGCPEPETLASFKDVKANDYYAKAVAWAVEEGITNGVGKNLFAPNDICTRGQIVTFLWRYAGKPAASAAAAFTDVDPAEYYADAVAWAVANGITEGITETRFVPEDACTRAQAITFLYRVAED